MPLALADAFQHHLAEVERPAGSPGARRRSCLEELVAFGELQEVFLRRHIIGTILHRADGFAQLLASGDDILDGIGLHLRPGHGVQGDGHGTAAAHGDGASQLLRPLVGDGLKDDAVPYR